MVANFLLIRKIAELVRRSRDDTRMDRYESIAELGWLPPTDESVACLIQHTCEGNSATAVSAIRALGVMNDRRATNHLVRLLRDKDARANDDLADALGRPHHATALPALAEMARAHCRDYAKFWLASNLVDLMRRIDPFASQPHIEALAPLVLESALSELRQEKPADVRPIWAEGILAQCQQPSGLAALRALQEELVHYHRQMLMTASRLSEIAQSLDWLRKSSRPSATEAVAEFLRTPSRRVIKSVSHDMSDDDSPGASYKSFDEPCYTSELGQPVGPEEVAEQVANAQARQAYEDAETKRRHRENVYPILLTHGDQRDLEDYAHACLTNPRYDIYLSDGDWRRDPGTPKLNKLASYLQRAPEMPKAAELLRLILAGDRTRLWASAHEALAWRGEYAGEIDWKPLAVELLEQTGDPAVDKLLISQIGAQWAAGKPSPLLAILARRNPAQMVELAARHLLRRSTCLGLDGEALDVVLASPPTALRVARELHERTDWWDRSPAFLIMCSLTGPEVEAELNAWVVAEVDHRIWDVVDQQKGVGFVKRRKAAAARPPSAESAPVPPTPPTATLHPPADHAVLWARVLACLEKRRAIPTGLATPGDIARHADAMLGHSEVSRFVFEYYYPAIYGETPVPDAARAWVEHFEKSA